MSLKWYKANLAGREIMYSAAFHALKGNPYVGEKQPFEIKLYFPNDQQVEDWVAVADELEYGLAPALLGWSIVFDAMREASAA